MGPNAVILLSGGLDSTTTLAIAKAQGFVLNALTVIYGQRHQQEIEAAQRVAGRMQAARHLITRIDLRAFGGSALTGDHNVPHDRSAKQMETGIPITYVPARNTILLSLALAWAETLDAGDIFIGVNALDYSGYPDCRPAFIEAFENLARLATRRGVEGNPIKVQAPLIQMTKAQIILRGIELGVDYGMTFTCYDPDAQGRACGSCDACQLRLKGFAEAGLEDQIAYQRPAR